VDYVKTLKLFTETTISGVNISDGS